LLACGEVSSAAEMLFVQDQHGSAGIQDDKALSVIDDSSEQDRPADGVKGDGGMIGVISHIQVYTAE
jgi:hypothetical protein